MKRDFELIKKILIEIESFKDTQWQRIKFDDYKQNEVDYQVMLLQEQDLIVAKDLRDSTGDDWRVSRLTSEGHDFLDAAKNDTVWKNAKQIIAKKVKKLVSKLSKLFCNNYC